MTFTSYYWHTAQLGSKVLNDARAILVGDDRAQAPTALATLLKSDRLAARGIALDHYHHAEATSRFGVDNPFGRQRDLVVREARSMLDDPPIIAGTEGAEIDGANHASALGALINLADDTDAGRVADAMLGAPNMTVLELALECAGTVLDQSHDPALVAATREVVLTETVAAAARGNALHVLAIADPDDARRLATELLRQNDIRLQAEASWLLVAQDLTRYRDLVGEVVAGWPSDAPYPAFEVRQLLAGND